MENKLLFPLFLVIFLVIFDVTMATIYRVGDSAGWNNNTGIDSSKGAASKTFIVGDVLEFQLRNPSDDNVFRVTAENNAACIGPSSIGLPSTGLDFWTLDSPGPWYFICSIPGRCLMGQKLAVLVHPASADHSQPSAPPPVPTNQPETPPAPSRNQRPTIPSPSPSPTKSPADEKSGAAAFPPVNFWVAIAVVVGSVCSSTQVIPFCCMH